MHCDAFPSSLHPSALGLVGARSFGQGACRGDASVPTPHNPSHRRELKRVPLPQTGF